VLRAPIGLSILEISFISESDKNKRSADYLSPTPRKGFLVLVFEFMGIIPQVLKIW
jgi:hypothetical protein